MLLEDAHCLGLDVTSAKFGHIASDKGFDELLVVEGADVLLKPLHQLRSDLAISGLGDGSLELLKIPSLIKVEGRRLS